MKRLVLVFALIISCQARAEMSANDVMENVCGPEGIEFEFACLNYVGGAIEMASFYQVYIRKEADYCTPSAFTNGIALKVWKKHLEENPEQLAMPAVATIHFAMALAYPCN